MKLHHAIAAMQLLPEDRASAITVPQFIDRWRRAGQPVLSDRQLQRWLPELEAENLVESVECARGSRKYYRLTNRTPTWAMTQETALRLLISSRMLEQPLRGIGNSGAGVLDIARSVISTSEATRRLHRKLRVVPDGIGRLQAMTEPGVQEAVIDAIVRNRQLRFEYRSRAGMQKPGRTRTHEGSLLGVVSKDGATYLLFAIGHADPVLTFALHRVLRAQVLPASSFERPDFDLDAHIEKSHQLSHAMGEAEVLTLCLRVHPDAIWHFRERPLCPAQSIRVNAAAEGWWEVVAPVPRTELLVPFLLSLAQWIVVDGPDSVRDEVLRRMKAAVDQYEERIERGNTRQLTRM